VLFGTAYWHDLLGWIGDELIAHGMISADDVQLLHVTDDPAEAVRLIVEGWEHRTGSTSPAEPEKADAQ
jgi:predicted Rossmann-fold nucleotide-binding protein